MMLFNPLNGSTALSAYKAATDAYKPFALSAAHAAIANPLNGSAVLSAYKAATDAYKPFTLSAAHATINNHLNSTPVLSAYKIANTATAISSTSLADKSKGLNKTDKDE